MKAEYYRETSTRTTERKLIALVALVIIGALFFKDYMNFQKTGALSPLGIGMDILLVIMLAWRTAFTYTLVLYKDNTMEVIQSGLGLKRSYTVDLQRVETFAQVYSRSFFRGTKISQYVHRYDSLDTNPQHLLVYTVGEKKKLVGLLFKSSDKFVRNMKKQFPDHYIDM